MLDTGIHTSPELGFLLICVCVVGLGRGDCINFHTDLSKRFCLPERANFNVQIEKVCSAIMVITIL